MFRLRDDAAESLLDPDSVSYLGATIRQLASLRAVIDPVVEAYRTGEGLAADAFGAESADGQGGSNRPVYLTTLPTEWLPNIEPFQRKLSAGATTVIDIGCGHGWSSIALALAYPDAVVDGYDPDAYSLEQARAHAEAYGVADRVRFHTTDAAAIDADGRPRDGVRVRARHARPGVGAGRRQAGAHGRRRDARGRRTNPRPVRRHARCADAYYYGWSLFDCLPAGRAQTPSAATGTVMRPDTLRGYAEAAGFSRFEALPIEHDAFRLYLLRP